ncbi:hypothetical protein [Arthrobacter sp. SAFR-044]|uniref:hypothetical protein n=1 Tax=Arthrobacter sp. SAFR-044 TaxID=3387278 RepID=UPI003F7B7D98
MLTLAPVLRQSAEQWSGVRVEVEPLERDSERSQLGMPALQGLIADENRCLRVGDF